MENPFDEIRHAVQQAKELDRAVASQAGAMATLLVGKLRHCPNYIVEQLKKELREFNIHTGEWKD